MANKVSQTFLLAVIVSTNLFIPSTIWLAEAKESKAVNKDLDKELLKKYGSYRPKEILYLKDSMVNGERVDLDNKYFKISYPKCFKVEPTVEDSDDITIKTSASLDLVRSKECKYHKANDDSNRMQVAYPNNMDFVDPEKIESYEPASSAVYRQMIDVNGAKGVLYLSIGISKQWDHMDQLNSVWNAYIACKGKNDEIFRFANSDYDKAKTISMMKNKKFDLPDDFKQIISSFQCRKDR